MTYSSRSIRTATLIALATSTGAGAALAEEPSAADVASARTLTQDGIRAADAGDCRGAVEKLEKASAILKAPMIQARLGECHVKLGRIVLGTEMLQQMLREAVPTPAPTVLLAARTRAEKVLAEARPRIGKLKVTVTAPPDAKPSVKIDGEPLPAALLDTERATDPGVRTVEVSAPGYLKVTQQVTVPEGAAEAVTLTLLPDPDAKSAAPPSASAAPLVLPPTQPPPMAPPAEAPASSPSRTPMIAAFAVGGVGFAVSAITGGLALGKKSDLDSACVDKKCPRSAQGDIDSIGTLGAVSTAGFVVGIAGVGIGTYFLLTSPGNKTAASLRVNVGARSVGLGGSF